MSGSPLIVVPETAQFAGVTAIWVAIDPSPELFSVPSISTESEMVPPPEHGPVEDKGKLQLSLDPAGVQPEEESGRTAATAADKLGRAPSGRTPPNALLSAGRECQKPVQKQPAPARQTRCCCWTWNCCRHSCRSRPLKSLQPPPGLDNRSAGDSFCHSSGSDSWFPLARKILPVRLPTLHP